MLTNNLNDDRDYLLPYFDEMLEWNGTKEDWKRRFNAQIPYAMFNEYNEAAIFFSGGPLEIVAWMGKKGSPDSDVLVLCKGYYEAIDANDDPISA